MASDQLEAISRTATKTERWRYDTPDTVSHIGSEALEQNQVQKLSDVFKDVPGVTFSNGPRAVAEKPNIRGLGGDRILITVDGARQNFNSGHKGRVFIETELLKAVDVLRGPGSAIYGSGAMAGVISMTTKDAADYLMPGEKFGVRVKAGYQDVNEDKLGTGILFGQSDFGGGLDYILSGTRRSSDDIKLGEDEILEDSASDTWAGLAKLNWTPTDNQRFTVSRQYSMDSGEVPAQADEITSATAVLTDRETEVTIDRLAYRYADPENAWLNFDAAVYNNAQTIREKRIGTNNPTVDVIDFNTRGLDLRNSTGVISEASPGQRLTYGVEYYQDEMESVKDGVSNRAFPDATAEFYGVYLQDEIELDSWVIIPGLRYDHYESESDQPQVTGVATSTKESQLSPKLGFIYKATQWMNLSFNYGQAFRAPSFQELYISGVHFGANNFEPNPNLKPEHLVHGIELGMRIRQQDMQTQGDRLDCRTSVYYNEYEDFIDSTVTAAATRAENIGEARIQGMELESNYYTPWIDAELNAAASVSFGEDLIDDEPLGNIPGHSLVLNAQKFLSGQDMSFGWRASFHRKQDRYNDNVIGAEETPGYSVHDVYLSWFPLLSGVDDMQVNFGIDNVFDKLYTPHLSSLPAPGRNIKVSMSMQF